MNRTACLFFLGMLVCGCLPRAAAIDEDSGTSTGHPTDMETITLPDSASEDTDSDTATANAEPAPDGLGNSSGGGLLSSERFEMRLIVGGSPMAEISSKRHRARLGIGARLEQ